MGKSTICKKLAEQTSCIWREVSKLAEEHNCLDEYDPEYQCPFLNEDKVITQFKKPLILTEAKSCLNSLLQLFKF